MSSQTEITASLEDYLEAIFHVTREKQAARAKDIGQRLQVKGASVTGALRSLSEKGLINYAPYDIITLTSRGKKAAEQVVTRHEALRNFFVKVLLANEKDAEEGACKMEHSLPGSILERLIEFMKFIEICPRVGKRWIDGFGYFYRSGRFKDDCENCMTRCLQDYQKSVVDRKSGEGDT